MTQSHGVPGARAKRLRSQVVAVAPRPLFIYVVGKLAFVRPCLSGTILYLGKNVGNAELHSRAIYAYGLSDKIGKLIRIFRLQDSPPVAIVIASIMDLLLQSMG